MNKLIKKNHGFTMLESVIFLGVLMLTMYGILTVNEAIAKQNALNEVAQNVALARNNITSLIRHPTVWEKIITSADNTTFDCVRNHANCRDQTGPFKVYDTNGDVFYDSSIQGFSTSGQPCTGFVDPSTNQPGVAECPFRLNLTWVPQCPPAGDCLDPMVQIRGEFLMNHPNMKSLPADKKLSFSFFLNPKTCPATAVFPNPSVGAQVTVNLNRVSGILNPIGQAYAYTNQILQNCHELHLVFTYDISGSVNDPKNVSSICLMPEAQNFATGACTFEWRHVHDGTRDRWRLYENGIQVFESPHTLLSEDEFEVIIKRGLVWVKRNRHTEFLFNELASRNLKVRFEPAPLNFSANGFRSIDLFAL